MRILAPFLLAACSGGTPATDGPPTHTGTTPTFTLPGDLFVDDDATLSYDATWLIAASQVRANAEIFVSWSTKTADAWGTERAADSFDGLVLWKLAASRSDVMTALAIDDLDAITVGTWRASAAGKTDARLSDLQGFDPVTELSEDGSVSWLLGLVDDDAGRTDLRDGVFLTPSATQPGINLSFPNTSNAYTWSMHFGNDELRTDAGKDRYTVDWSALTVDGYGKAFDTTRIDEVFVGRFDSVNEADDLGAELLDLKAVADGWWTTNPGGFPTAVLSDAKDDAGLVFPGFEADTSWLIGGRCRTCLGPAPMWLTVVDVRQP